MSTLESRELLIQQRQAEKYINVIRMILMVFITAGLLLRGSGRWSAALFPQIALAAAWFYSLAVHWSLSRGFFPRYLPWVTTLTDLFFIAVALISEVGLSSRTFASLSAGLTWGYALLFLVILFSTLRERAELTLVNGVVCTGLYGVCLLVYFPREPFVGFWTEQSFRMVLLLLAGFFSSFHARTVRKAFERAATADRLRRETDSRLKVLALHFPGVLFQAEVEGRDFRLRYVSEGCRDLLGVESRELMDDPTLFFAKAEPGLAQTLWDRLESDQESYRAWEVSFLYQKLWLNMSVTSHRTFQGTLVVNGLLTDVTEQKNAAEALREANQAKTDFLATMSHELRTPLNAILGNADHLARLADLPDDRKAFRDLQGSAETLLGLIEDILVFSRLEAGRLTAETRPFAWKAQLEAVLESFRRPAEAKGLALSLETPPGVPPLLWTDALRLRQIVGNLLSNAIKFTPGGRVSVIVRFDAGASDSWMVLSVVDTGIGVPEAHRAKIFEKFTQGEHGKSRTYGGLGLGLSISRSLAELLGGTLRLESSGDAGSVFTLRIPVRMGDGTPTLAGGTEHSGADPGARILLVEDNLTNQDVALRMLRKLGAQVDLAPGGLEAVAAATKNYYDLIFMDWQMPGMDGREATARIRALPGGQDFVIVALSGHALPGDRELLLASGFDDYLSKPVRMDDFRTALARWVTPRRGPN